MISSFYFNKSAIFATNRINLLTKYIKHDHDREERYQ